MLTKEQIQFTDRYLEQSGIKYMDIRHEMTDHVISALENKEGNFYENFRLYMVQHKQELMQSNRYFRKLALRRALGILKSNVLKPAFWVIALIIFCIASIAKQYIGTEREVMDNLEMAGMIVPLLLNLYFIHYWMFKKEVHSVLMKLLLFMYFGAFIFRIPGLIHNTNFLIGYYSLYISFYLLLIQSIWQLNRQYKLAYNG